MRKGFISYSHADKEVCVTLFNHLADVNRSLVRFWYDRKLVPGATWNEEIGWHIQRTHIALVLVSADAMKPGGFVIDTEVPLLQRNVRKRGAVLIPVAARPYDAKGALAISSFEAIPDKGKPLGRDASPGEVDVWCARVVAEIRTYVEGLANLDEHGAEMRSRISAAQSALAEIEESDWLDQLPADQINTAQKHLTGIGAALRAPRADFWSAIHGVLFAWEQFLGKLPAGDVFAPKLRDLRSRLEALEHIAQLNDYDWPPNVVRHRRVAETEPKALPQDLAEVDSELVALEQEALYLGQTGNPGVKSMETEIADQSRISR